MRHFLLLALLLQSTLFTPHAMAASQCFDLFSVQSIKVEKAAVPPPPPEVVAPSRRQGSLLDLSFIPGLKSGVFELWQSGGMITSKSGAFVCINCGRNKKIEKIPYESKLSCDGCGGSMTMNQKQIPPMVLIKDSAGNLYVWEANIVRNKQVVEYFETDAVGCTNCGTINLKKNKECVTCTDTEFVKVDGPAPREVSLSAVRRDPSIIYPELIRMGVVDVNVARRSGLISREALYELSKEMKQTHDMDLKTSIKRGFINPRDAVQKEWISIKQRRKVVTELIEESFVTVDQAIQRGWMVKAYAIKSGLITAEGAAALKEPEAHKPNSLAGQARERREDLGEEDPIHTAPIVSSGKPLLPPVKVDAAQKFWSWKNLDPFYKKGIKIAAVGAVAVGIIAKTLLHQWSPETGPVNVGKVVDISQYVVVYESQAVKDQYAGIRLDVDNLPDGVSARVNESLTGVLKPASPAKAAESGHGIMEIYSVITVDAGGVVHKIYRDGQAAEAFPHHKAGDKVPVFVEEFSLKMGEPVSE